MTLGLGLGAFGGEMDYFLILLPQSLTLLEVRDTEFGKGGELSSGAFFSGSKVGLFGGVSYQLDHLPVNVQLEYNPDQYNWQKSNRANGLRDQKPLECRSNLGGSAGY